MPLFLIATIRNISLLVVVFSFSSSFAFALPCLPKRVEPRKAYNFSVNSPLRIKNSRIQVLAGKKDAGSAIYVNNKEAIPKNNFQTWYYEYPLKNANNKVAISMAVQPGRTQALQSFDLDKGVKSLNIEQPMITGYRFDAQTKDFILTIKDPAGVLSYNIYYANQLSSTPGTSPFILAQPDYPASGTGITQWRDNGRYTGIPPADPRVKMRFYRLEICRLESYPPVGIVAIQGNPVYINTSNVFLALFAFDETGGSGLDTMQFSNDGVNWSAPVAYSMTANWTLSPNDGAKKIYARFSDKAGNLTFPPAVCSVILDQTSPATPVINALPVSTEEEGVRLSGSKEAGASIYVDSVCVVPWDPYTTWSCMVSLQPGLNALRIYSQDRAGNKSPVVSVQINRIAILSNQVIQDKIDAAKQGETVYIPPGIYKGKSIDLKSGIYLKGDNALTTVIEDQSKTSEGVIEAKENTVIDGFTLRKGKNGIICLAQGSGSFVAVNCIVTGSDGSGIRAENLETVVIRNNISFSHAYSGLHVRNCSAVEVANNALDGNSDNGMYYIPVSQNCRIFNNIMSNNGNYGVYHPQGSPPPDEVSNNDFWNNGRGAFNCYQPDSTNIFADPLFFNRVTGLYFLRPESPCVDRGKNNLYTAFVLGNKSTQYNGALDRGSIDLGFHFNSPLAGGPNQPPVIDTIGEKTVSPGNLLEFKVNGFDPNGKSIIFQVENLPVGASFDSAAGKFSWEPTLSQRGIWNVGFVVSDGEMSSRTQATVIVDTPVTPSSISYNVYPTIFLHGMTGKPMDLSGLINKVKPDNASVVCPVFAGDSLGINTYPPTTMFSAGYYKENKDNPGDYDYQGRIGGGPVASEGGIPGYNSRTEYARQLQRIVENVCLATGAQKVNIVAHSLGGLVARAYIRWLGGGNRVNKLLMIGTPNHGIPGTEAFFSDWAYKDMPGWMLGGEIAEMDQDGTSFGGHSYMWWLNTDDKTYKKVQYATIAGNYTRFPYLLHCDGVVDLENVYLPFAIFNPVVFAAHNDTIGSNELSLTSCTYTVEFIRRWMFQDRIEKGATLPVYGANPSPITPYPNPFGTRQLIDFEVAHSNAVSMQLIMSNITGTAVDNFAYPIYAGVNQMTRDFKNNPLVGSGAYFYDIRAYDMEGVIGTVLQVRSACIPGTPDSISLLPETTITDVSVSDSSATFSYRSDRGREFSYKFDNGDWSGWTTQSNLTAGFLEPGYHIFWVRSRIPSYYVDPTPATYVFNIRGPLDILTLGEGTQSSFHDRANISITSNAQWHEIWRLHTQDSIPALSLPVVDFSREIVIAVFMGECRTSGYSTHISRVVENAGYIAVHISEGRPPAGAVVMQVLTYPFQIIKLRKASEQVAFIYD